MCPKTIHEYATIKPEVKRVFSVTRSYAAAGISQYRLIKVASIVCLRDRVSVVRLVGLEYVVLDDVLVTNGLLLLPFSCPFVVLIDLVEAWSCCTVQGE